MIRVLLAGTSKELFQLNMSPVPFVGDELMLNDDTYLVTGRRFVLEKTQRDTKNVEHTIVYVQEAL